MLRVLPVLCAFALLAASGIAQRLWTGTWTLSDEPAASAARLANVPLSIADWQGIDQEVNTRQMEQAEAVGYLSRHYVQRRTKAEVSILIVCGRPGPIAVHPPNICYGGIGFQMVGDATHYQFQDGADGPKADFLRQPMLKPDLAVPVRLRVYWAWSSNGKGWRAPDNPRLVFGGAPALYKMYLIYRPAPGAELPENDPCIDFMHALLPELEKALAPTP